MPSDIQRLRDATKQLVLGHIAKDRKNPYSNYGQVSFAEYQSIVSKLPAGDVPEAQVMDPASPNYGKFYFLVDYSQVGSDEVIV